MLEGVDKCMPRCFLGLCWPLFDANEPKLTENAFVNTLIEAVIEKRGTHERVCRIHRQKSS
jgi:hypothetical protein